MNELTIRIDDQSKGISPYVPEELNEKSRVYIQAGIEGSKNTQRATKSDLKQYKKWCETNHVNPVPIPLGALIQYTTFLAETISYHSILRHLISISKIHTLGDSLFAGKEREFKIFLKGIRRIKTSKQKQAPDFDLDELRIAVGSQPDSAAGIRNRAILLLGYSGAFRRSELVELNIEDLQIDHAGLVITMTRSKTNQNGEIEMKSVPRASEEEYCPVRTVKKWIELLDRQTGPLFVRVRKNEQITEERLADNRINKLIKELMDERYTAHSLRASFVTITRKNGADDREIMNQTKHKSTMMIDRYDRRNNIRKTNASNKSGL